VTLLIQKPTKKTVKPFLFLHGTAETDFPGIAETGGKIMDGLDKYVKAREIKVVGPVIWMYDHIGGGKVKLRAGVPVAGVTRAGQGFSVRKQAAWPCVSTLYAGSMKKIPKAWDEFTEAVREIGLTPINKNREVYLKWIGFDSKANLTELQVAVQARKSSSKKS
jgi:hypothetical protein